MTRPRLPLPEKIRHNAALMGEAGRVWLADLPQQIVELECHWRIVVAQPMPRGSEAFVAHARTSDGLAVVVKIVIPGFDPARQEIQALRRANGVGYARLIQCDAANNAMLLEMLGPQLHAFHLSESRRMEVICATLREAWTPGFEGTPLATGADKSVELSRIIESNWDD